MREAVALPVALPLALPAFPLTPANAISVNTAAAVKFFPFQDE